MCHSVVTHVLRLKPKPSTIWQLQLGPLKTQRKAASGSLQAYAILPHPAPRSNNNNTTSKNPTNLTSMTTLSMPNDETQIIMWYFLKTHYNFRREKNHDCYWEYQLCLYDRLFLLIITQVKLPTPGLISDSSSPPSGFLTAPNTWKINSCEMNYHKWIPD